VHGGEQLLDQLLAGDGAAPLLALAGVPQRHLEGLARQPERARREREPAVVEGRERDLHPAADLAEDGVVVDADPLERDLGGVAGAQPELAVDLAAGVAVRVLRDEEAGHPTVLTVDDRAGEHHRHRALGAVGDEDLRPVDGPAVAVPHGAGDHLEGLEPAAGSVRPNAPSSPPHRPGTHRSCCASVPQATIDLPTRPTLTDTIERMELSAAPTSSTTTR
jgi:hypothetical protein